MKVAIVGGGIAGLAAARGLAGRADVTLYEAGTRVGGHVYTVDAEGHAIDMGFIVCNRPRYPQFTRMLDELGIPTRDTTMAFSVAVGDLAWGSADLGAMFADRRRLADPHHWRFLALAWRFLARARRDLARGDALLARASLAEYVAARAGGSTQLAAELEARFVVPLAAALWSLAPERCGEFPALTYVKFLEHHGMLRAFGPPPTWTTIVGGSRRYVDALVGHLIADGVAFCCATPVARIARTRAGVTIHTRGGGEARYDRVVIATHADTALALLARPSDAERAVLGAFRYSDNRTVLHTDRAFLPAFERAHAAWNYVADPDTSRVAVTYSMTKLQGLPDRPYLVTLNPRREPANALHATTFAHPQFDRAALAAQARLPGLGAAHRTYYAGAHFGWGFHEDGMCSGLAAAASLLADRHRPAVDP